MDTTARCPNPACGREFRVKPEWLGKTAACKGCGQSFILSAATPEIAHQHSACPGPTAQGHAAPLPNVRPIGAGTVVGPLPTIQHVEQGQKSAAPAPNTAPLEPRLWFGLLLVISGVLSPFFPAFTLIVGVLVASLILLYTSADPSGPIRRDVGRFLRVSTDRPTARRVKLTTLSLVAIALMGSAAVGYVSQRRSAQLAAKKETDAAARVQAQAVAEARLAADEAARAGARLRANEEVIQLVAKAKSRLAQADVTAARKLIDAALKLNAAQNRDLALALEGAIKNSEDSAWALDLLMRLSDAELAAFKAGGKPPASLDLGYAVLTEKAVTNARDQIDAVVAKHAEIKKQEEEAAKARRQQAAAAAEAARKKAEAEAKERRKTAEAKAAAEAAERAKFEKGMGETIHIGYTSYCAWDAHWSDRLSSNRFLDKRANANWLFVKMTVRNNDKQARMVPPIQLIDESGREYESSAEATMIEDSIGLLETLNPDVSKTGYVVFDVPKGRTYKLRLSGGYWSSDTGYIRLNPTEK